MFLRLGQPLLVLIAFLGTAVPWQVSVRPAEASGGRGDIEIPPLVYHYHHDHLGSTLLITQSQGAYKNGDTLYHVRYSPNGEIRGRYLDDGTLFTTPLRFHAEFTGYDTDETTGLQYAGARFYNPQLGRFLSHDPLRQFPDPYTYAGADPVNLVDPGGMAAFNAAGTCDARSRNYHTPAGNLVFWQPGLGSASVAETIGPPSQSAAAGFLHGQVTDRFTVRTGWPDNPCIGGDCTLKLSDSNGNFGPSVARTAGEIAAAQLIPGAGEALDAITVMDSSASWWIRGLAGASLAVGVLTWGISPNISPFLRSARRVQSGFEGPGDVAAAFSRSGVCFAAGTLVHAEDGLIPIEDVEVGDRVWSRDPRTGRVELRHVLRALVSPGLDLLAMTFASHGAEESIEVTGEHPFFVKGKGWMPARQLAPDDQVFSLAGGWLRLTSATGLQAGAVVYNLEVDAFHTYFVGQAGAWVHNTCAAEGFTRVSGHALAAMRREFDRVAKPAYCREYASQIDAGVVSNPFHSRVDNIARMRAGRPPIGPDNFSVNLHHVRPLQYGGSNSFANLVPITATSHQRLTGLLHRPPF